MSDNQDWVLNLTRFIAQLDDEELADRIAHTSSVVMRIQLEHQMLVAELSYRTHARPGGSDDVKWTPMPEPDQKN